MGQYELVKDIIINDVPMEEDDGSLIYFSQLSHEEIDELFIPGIVDGFDTQIVILGEYILFRKLNLVWLKGNYFELLEATKSGDNLKIRDGKGDVYEYELRDKNHKKNKSTVKSSSPRPPNTEGGKDALDSLYRS